MAEAISQAELEKLVAQFNSLPAGAEKNAFFHANPALHTIYRSVHFPRPVAVPNGAGAPAEAAPTSPAEPVKT